MGSKWGPHHVSLTPFSLGTTRHAILLDGSSLGSYLTVYHSLLLTLGLPTCLWSAEHQGSVTGGHKQPFCHPWSCTTQALSMCFRARLLNPL